MRTHTTQNISTYPLNMEQRLQQGDAFRESSERLKSSLSDIERQYLKGKQTQIARFRKEKQDLIRSCYEEYYMSSDPRAWYNQLSTYKREMHNLLDRPNEFNLTVIHHTYNKLLQTHLINDLTAGMPSNPREIRAMQEMAYEAFQHHSGSSDGDFRNQIIYFLSLLQERAPSRAMADAVRKLQTTKSPTDRSKLFINYYCSPSPDDTVQQKNFKAKFARMFDQSVPHDEVYESMQKEAHSSKEVNLRNYRNELEGLQGALAAQQKLKKRKEEKDRPMPDQESTPGTTICSFSSCSRHLDLSEMQLECAVCQWLDAKGSGCTRFFYCSLEHAEEDFVRTSNLLHRPS
jgi:hypothetical protein